jgi:hypothetical protein
MRWGSSTEFEKLKQIQNIATSFATQADEQME